MAILVDKKTVVLVQGITGKEGARATKEMIEYGTKVVAGVTPGKGGTVTEDGVPVFNSVKEATNKFPEINASLIVVPAPFVYSATSEAIESNIPLVNILTEHVPVFDVARLIALAKRKNITIIGPSSVGIISPNKGKIGSIGSSGSANKIFTQGSVGLISKSGGMTAEISRILSEKGLGQSAVVGIGGDLLIGATFVDIALLFEVDRQTEALVVFGEIGGTYEEALAEAMRAGRVTKPVVALIVGHFSEKLPQGTVLGHAGAIVNQGRGSYSSKINALKEAGAHIVETPE